MLLYPLIDPIAFHIGSWPVYWYGLMYLFGFLMGWGLLSLRLFLSSHVIAPEGCLLSGKDKLSQEQLADMLFFAAFGVILGGRLGYMIFYYWHVLWAQPLLLFQVWKGGMSFHGGLIGVMIALGVYAYRTKRSFIRLTDLVAPVVPIGLGLGRLGNFINGELWGRVSSVPWAMVFPGADTLPRHPSQLYEFFFEGVLLFIILWFYSRKPRPLGAVSGLFSLGYGVFRLGVEFFREPDPQIGFFWGCFTEGQLLSLPMILVGITLLIWTYFSKSRIRQ